MRKKKTRRNSGGLSIYFTSCFSDGITLIKEDHDDKIWLKLSKTFLGFEKDIFCCLCYAIPVGSSRQDLVTEDILIAYKHISLHLKMNMI